MALSTLKRSGVLSYSTPAGRTAKIDVNCLVTFPRSLSYFCASTGTGSNGIVPSTAYIGNIYGVEYSFIPSGYLVANSGCFTGTGFVVYAPGTPSFGGAVFSKTYSLSRDAGTAGATTQSLFFSAAGASFSNLTSGSYIACSGYIQAFVPTVAGGRTFDLQADASLCYGGSSTNLQVCRLTIQNEVIGQGQVSFFSGTLPISLCNIDPLYNSNLLVSSAFSSTTSLNSSGISATMSYMGALWDAFIIEETAI